MTLPDTLRGRFEELLNRLTVQAQAVGYREVRRGHGDSYMACCPAHDDRNPSLSVALEPDRILVHCFAGCATEAVCAAVDMPVAALFSDYRGGQKDEPRLSWEGRKEFKAEVARFVEEIYGVRPLDRVSQLDDDRKPLPPPVREFLDMDFPPQTPLLGPITTQQIVMLYAPPGVGKTMFTLGIAHAIAAGQDFVGWTCHERARVLVVDGEMAGEMMQRRMAGAGLEEDWLRVANLANWGEGSGYEPVNLCTAEGQDVVAVWAEACDSRVIILDNLMSLAWMDGVTMSSDEFWQPVRRFAARMRAEGRTVIVVDHTNAAGDIFGTKTKLWHSDLAIQLSPVASETSDDGLTLAVPQTRFRLAFQKVRGTPDPAGQLTAEKVITMGRVGQDWAFVSGRLEQRALARSMKENGLSIRDIAEELGLPKSTVGRWCK